jgi:CubicO group peptidase (beta-lactamase class C family)
MKALYLTILTFIFSFQLHSQNLYFPPLVGNSWDSILPSNLNYCPDRIDSLFNYLQAKNTKSFILLKNGKRVFEKYFGTYTKDSLFYWASASKSLASFITGIAQQKGFININNPASQYLGIGWTSAPLVKENLILVKDLLKMTSGLDDTPPLPCDNEDTAKTCLLYQADANTRWAYHTGAYRHVQDVVSNSVGLSYNAITNAWIESKTGMNGIWSQQVYFSKARDMARFGLLTLNKGIWNNDTLMKDSVYYNNMVNSSQTLNKAYGYLWWLNGKSDFMSPQVQFTFPGSLIPNAPSDMFCALGKNDQKIYIVPSQNIVIIRQGNSAGGFNLASSSFDNALWDYINLLTCGTVSTPIVPIQNKVQVFPNPVEETLTIVNANQSIKVWDLLGNLIYNVDALNQKTEINFSNYKKGIYILEFEDKNEQKFRKHIVKQ